MTKEKGEGYKFGAPTRKRRKRKHRAISNKASCSKRVEKLLPETLPDKDVEEQTERQDPYSEIIAEKDVEEQTDRQDPYSEIFVEKMKSFTAVLQSGLWTKSDKELTDSEKNKKQSLFEQIIRFPEMMGYPSVNESLMKIIPEFNKSGACGSSKHSAPSLHCKELSEAGISSNTSDLKIDSIVNETPVDTTADIADAVSDGSNKQSAPSPHCQELSKASISANTSDLNIDSVVKETPVDTTTEIADEVIDVSEVCMVNDQNDDLHCSVKVSSDSESEDGESKLVIGNNPIEETPSDSNPSNVKDKSKQQESNTDSERESPNGSDCQALELQDSNDEDVIGQRELEAVGPDRILRCSKKLEEPKVSSPEAKLSHTPGIRSSPRIAKIQKLGAPDENLSKRSRLHKICQKFVTTNQTVVAHSPNPNKYKQATKESTTTLKIIKGKSYERTVPKGDHENPVHLEPTGKCLEEASNSGTRNILHVERKHVATDKNIKNRRSNLNLGSSMGNCSSPIRIPKKISYDYYKKHRCESSNSIGDDAPLDADNVADQRSGFASTTIEVCDEEKIITTTNKCRGLNQKKLQHPSSSDSIDGDFGVMKKNVELRSVQNMQEKIVSQVTKRKLPKSLQVDCRKVVETSSPEGVFRNDSINARTTPNVISRTVGVIEVEPVVTVSTPNIAELKCKIPQNITKPPQMNDKPGQTMIGNTTHPGSDLENCGKTLFKNDSTTSSVMSDNTVSEDNDPFARKSRLKRRRERVTRTHSTNKLKKPEQTVRKSCKAVRGSVPEPSGASQQSGRRIVPSNWTVSTVNQFTRVQETDSMYESSYESMDYDYIPVVKGLQGGGSDSETTAFHPQFTKDSDGTSGNKSPSSCIVDQLVVNKSQNANCCSDDSSSEFERSLPVAQNRDLSLNYLHHAPNLNDERDSQTSEISIYGGFYKQPKGLKRDFTNPDSPAERAHVSRPKDHNHILNCGEVVRDKRPPSSRSMSCSPTKKPREPSLNLMPHPTVLSRQNVIEIREETNLHSSETYNCNTEGRDMQTPSSKLVISHSKISGLVRAVALVFEDDEDDYFTIRRPRWIRQRTDDFNMMDEIDFSTRYRLSKSSVLSVLEQIEGGLEYDSDSNEDNEWKKYYVDWDEPTFFGDENSYGVYYNDESAFEEAINWTNELQNVLKGTPVSILKKNPLIENHIKNAARQVKMFDAIGTSSSLTLKQSTLAIIKGSICPQYWEGESCDKTCKKKHKMNCDEFPSVSPDEVFRAVSARLMELEKPQFDMLSSLIEWHLERKETIKVLSLSKILFTKKGLNVCTAMCGLFIKYLSISFEWQPASVVEYLLKFHYFMMKKDLTHLVATVNKLIEYCQVGTYKHKVYDIVRFLLDMNGYSLPFKILDKLLHEINNNPPSDIMVVKDKIKSQLKSFEKCDDPDFRARAHTFLRTYYPETTPLTKKLID